MRRVLLGGCAALMGWSCAARGPNPALEAARVAAALRAEAEAQVLRGCYDCLLEARDAYARLAAGPFGGEIAVRRFEVELLIALREKELALNAEPTLSRARALGPHLPAAVASDRLLAVVEAVPPDGTGLPVAADSTFRRSQAQYLQTIDSELLWLGGHEAIRSPVRQYLRLALDCSYFRRGRRAPNQPPRQVVADGIPADAPTLVTYRAGICDNIRSAPLTRVREQDPRYAEAAYFLARLHVSRAQETGGAAARPLLGEAYARFPNSPAVTYLAGNFEQLVGDCQAALRFYDETLVIQPAHDNALLGRTICLAYLKRFDDSIATATKMIGIPTWNLPEAYYWRAWVHHFLGELSAARSDIEHAKGIASSNDIHRLAGIIEYDQDDLVPAEKDLQAAKTMMNGTRDCVSRWYLGLLELKRERWLASASHFEDAMACYETSAALAAQGLRRMEANQDIDPDFRARQIAGFQAAIKEDTSQQFASAFNAANHSARGGNLIKARALLDIAARDAALAARVAELRKILDGGFDGRPRF